MADSPALMTSEPALPPVVGGKELDDVTTWQVSGRAGSPILTALWQPHHQGQLYGVTPGKVLGLLF